MILEAGKKRVVIENVRPQIEGGRFPIKRAVGEKVTVTADIFSDGHDAVSAMLLDQFVRFTVFIIATSMALELLGIGENTVLIAFAIVLGGVVLALSIAYGVGGKDAAKDHIEKMLKQKKDKDEITHI
jgi:hypothetical protein